MNRGLIGSKLSMLLASDVPDANDLVRAARGHELAIGGNGDRESTARMSVENPALRNTRMPQANSAIAARGNKRIKTGKVGHSQHRSFMIAHHLGTVGSRVPEPDRAV